MLEQPHVTPDPMMEELYSIKGQIYDETCQLSPEERIAWYHQQAQQAARLIGCKLVPDTTQRNVHRFVPVNEP